MFDLVPRNLVTLEAAVGAVEYSGFHYSESESVEFPLFRPRGSGQGLPLALVAYELQVPGQ